jgi:glycosyltransferase involved in cell wall biosynthesis
MDGCKMPLVIAHVLPSFGLGGQERVALRLATQQQASGHRALAVSLAPPPEGALAEEFRQAGIEPLTVPKKGRGLDFGLPARLAAEFRGKDVTVVHAHNPQALIYAALAGKAAGATVVYTCHGQNSLAPGRLWLTRLASLLIDAYVGVSPRIVERARCHHECPEAKLLVIENGVDLSAFRPDADARREVRAELGLPEAAWVVGTVGRLVEDKDPGLLLRAALPLLGPDARLVFVGDGPLYPALQAMAARHPAGHCVSFLGARHDVPRLLAAFDVFALSSRTEGLPLALLEAMAVGLPIVATAVGGVPDVVRDGWSARLVPSADEAALREALAQLRGHPTAAVELGRCAREESLRFSAASMTTRYLDLYHRCRVGPLAQKPFNLV